MAMVQLIATIKQGADIMNSHCSYMDEGLRFFLESQNGNGSINCNN